MGWMWQGRKLPLAKRSASPSPFPSLPLGRTWKPECIFVLSFPEQQAAPLGTHTSCSQLYCSCCSQLSLLRGVVPETGGEQGWSCSARGRLPWFPCGPRISWRCCIHHHSIIPWHFVWELGDSDGRSGNKPLVNASVIFELIIERTFKSFLRINSFF